MNQTKDFLSAASLALAITLTLTGCAQTKIMVEMEQPSTFEAGGLNTNCIKRIALVPFKHDSKVYYGEELAEHATMIITKQLQGMERRYTLVDNPDSADAVVSGEIVNAYSVWSEQVDPLLKRKTFYTKAYVQFNYSLKIVKSGEIRYINKKGSGEEGAQWSHPLPNDLMKEAVTSAIGYIYKDFNSQRVSAPRVFAREVWGSKAVKEELKKALVLVEAKDYKAALEAYLAIYEEHKSYAAAINAAVIYELFGDTEAALKMARQATDKEGKPVDQAYIDILNGLVQSKAKANEGCE